jgi:hypothetical protein
MDLATTHATASLKNRNEVLAAWLSRRGIPSATFDWQTPCEGFRAHASAPIQSDCRSIASRSRQRRKARQDNEMALSSDVR